MATKKPSPKQLAARAKFAAAAKSGALARKRNPAKKRAKVAAVKPPAKTPARAKNPARRPAESTLKFAVHHAGASESHPGPIIARFHKRDTAVQYARAYADAHNASVVVVGD